MTREERLRSEDMGKYCRVAADDRDLNYDKFVVKGEVHTMADESYTSHNTNRCLLYTSRGARRWYFRTFEPQPTAIIYDERRGISRLIEEHGLKNKDRHGRYVSIDMSDIGKSAGTDVYKRQG